MEGITELAEEVRALRATVEALVSALTPADEHSPERDLITVLSDLTAAVDDAAGAVTSMHSTVSALGQRVSVSA